MTWQPNTLTKEQKEARRLEGARLLKEGWLSKAEIARRLGVSRTSVHQWAKKIRSGGIRRLKKRKSTGRPAKLTRQQKRRLSRLLKKGAVTSGFETERWTLSRIANLIKREFDVDYNPNYLPRLLKPLGFSVQHPVDRAVEREDELVEAWLKRDWLRIKKSASVRD